MRISNKCYTKDLRSIELGRRMLRLQARTETICAWAELTADRVRNLSRVLAREGVSHCAARQRGPSPSKFAAVMESPTLRKEAPAIGGLCRVYGVIPAEPCRDPQTRLPGVGRGERLCDALELFRHLVPGTRITLEKVVLLVYTLAAGDSWALEFCSTCQASILIDRLALSPRLCSWCATRGSMGRRPTVAKPAIVLDRETDRLIQQSLFPSVYP